MRTQCSFNRRRPSTRQKQKGVVAILVGMTIVIMVGMVGLAIDLGQLFVSKTELQNAADACALAGVNAMPAGLESSESAATTVAQRHKVLFQKSNVGGSNSRVTVEYSQNDVNGEYRGRTGFAQNEKPNFVKCKVERSSISTYFIQVLNALPGVSIDPPTMSAVAIAKKISSQTSCSIPVAVCNADVLSAKKGQWIENDFNAPMIGRGIRWVDFRKPGSPASGSSDVAELLTGPGMCALPATGSDVYEPGVRSSLPAAYNTRFGVYSGYAKPGDIFPDFTGHGYSASNWPAPKDAYEDFLLKRASNAQYIPPNYDSEGKEFDVRGKAEGSAFLRANGRDRRVVPVPVIDCDSLDKSKTAPLSSWACVLLLHPISNDMGGKTQSNKITFEYLGSAKDPSGPCASTGLPGGSGSGGPPVAALVR